MKSYLLLLCVIFLFSCSDQRKCKCGDDIAFSWKDGVNLDNIDVQIPNAVLNIGHPLSIKVKSITTPEVFLEPMLEWKLQSAKLFKDNQIFLDNINLDDFVKNNSTIEFPHDLFTSSNGDLVTGPVSVELIILFPKSETHLNINGTIFFYACEDILDAFGREDCRWSYQETGDLILNPC